MLLVLSACNQAAERPAPQPKLELRAAPPDVADVAGVVRTELSQARRDGRQLVVYVGAAWCEPCTRFHDAALAGELDAALDGVRLLEFDHDVWSDALVAAGYTSDLIPLFALPNSDGTASGKQFEGAIKGKDAVAQISPRLAALLGR
jgi:hypothetical protein